MTGNLADEVGKNDATTVMNNSKIQVIKDNVQNVDDIYNIVVNVAQQNNVNLDSDQINKIVEYLTNVFASVEISSTVLESVCTFCCSVTRWFSDKNETAASAITATVSMPITI